jgi:hypothetical protein
MSKFQWSLLSYFLFNVGYLMLYNLLYWAKINVDVKLWPTIYLKEKRESSLEH